jgi:hypothetical protein
VVVTVCAAGTQTVETVRGPYAVSLSLTPTGTLVTTVSGNTASGTITFSNLKVLTAGTFSIVAASTSITPATSSTFSVVNYVTTVSISADNTAPSANFPVVLTVRIYGDDSNYYVSSASVSISESTSSMVVGSNTATTSTGQATFSVYFTSSGSKSVVATCSSKTSSVAIAVSANRLKFDSISPTPATSLDTISVTVHVYDTNGVNPENSHGSYSISVALTSNGVLTGTASGSTTNGVLGLAGLRILSAGSFNFVASSTGMIGVTSASAYTVTNYAFYVTVTPATTTPSMNFNFGVTVVLNGEDHNPYTAGCIVTLTSTETVHGTVSGTSDSTGTATMSIFFSTIGSKTITATCPASTPFPSAIGYATVTVQSLQVSITSIVPTVIST